MTLRKKINLDKFTDFNERFCADKRSTGEKAVKKA